MISEKTHNFNEIPNKQAFMFNPFEIAFCGYSNSGKTTLITKIIQSLKDRFEIGYIKSDVHSFEMDHEGKDTYKASRAGASDVYISDANHGSLSHFGEPDLALLQMSFLNCDLVLMEGYKNSFAKKIVILDDENSILNDVQSGEIDHVLAFVGAADQVNVPDLNRPYFNRNDVKGIESFLLEHFRAETQIAPLFGLILTGGKSTRMNEDKAFLEYKGKSQIQACHELLTPLCDQTFVSSRPGQRSRSEVGGIAQIEDRFLGFGPLGGILSAMSEYPKATWVVLACDLPYLNHSTLEYLIQMRDPFRYASGYQSTFGDFIEPLCTVYEPKMLRRIMQFLALGYRCPHKILSRSRTQGFANPEEQSLKNINTPEEFQAAKYELLTQGASR